MKKVFAFVLISCLFSCANHDYYNDMVNWADNIPKGTSIEKIKQQQPTYLNIDWTKKDSFESYPITYIKGHNDPFQLSPSNFLVFRDNKYLRRDAKK